MKIVIDDKVPNIYGLLEPFSDVVYVPGNEINPGHIEDADAMIIRTRTRCNEKLLKGSSIKFIATATIGYDHIDTNWCNENGIIWKNAEGCNSGSVKQYIATSLASLALEYDFNFPDKTLGIVGLGNVGKKVLKVGEALEMRIVLNDPPLVRNTKQCGFISLEGVIREADILTLHVPLNRKGIDKTYHLLGNHELFKMNKGSFLINTSRGEVVDNQSWIQAIKEGILKGSVIDVWEGEPNLNLELLELATIATPHVAGYSADGKANATTMCVNALSKFFNLPLTDWKAEPETPMIQPIIEIDCHKKSLRNILIEAILGTYNIYSDSNNLKRQPGNFEFFRGNYPIRREFDFYQLKLMGANKEVIDRLHWLGFKKIV